MTVPSVHEFHPTHHCLWCVWGGEICLPPPHPQTGSVERKERWHRTQDGRTGSHAQLCMGRGPCSLPTSAPAAGPVFRARLRSLLVPSNAAAIYVIMLTAAGRGKVHVPFGPMF